MKQVNIYDAKTHLSKLVDEVQNGEPIIIARAGKPVAALVKQVPKQRHVTFGIYKNHKKIVYSDEMFSDES